MGVGAGRPLRSGLTGAGGGVAPKPGAAPGRTPLPWDTNYEQKIAGVNRSYLTRTGNFDLDETATKQDFGLEGPYADVASNPNSRAALLEESYRAANRGAMNSAGLQLYSGSTSNRLAANRSSYSLNRDQLEKAYRDSLQGISAERAASAERRAEEEREAGQERVEAAERAPLDPETAPAGRRKRRRRRRR